MTVDLTPEDVYAFFTESDPPENYEGFGTFGSPDCLPPVGPDKPVGLTDLGPFQHHQPAPAEERPARTPRRQPQPEFHSHGRRGRGRQKPAPPPPKKPFKPFSVADSFVSAPSSVWGRSAPDGQAARPPVIGWGGPVAKPKVASFAELLESEAKQAPRRGSG
jgi:hypothetical protein